MFKPDGLSNSLWDFLLFWHHFLLGIVKIGLALKLSLVKLTSTSEFLSIRMLPSACPCAICGSQSHIPRQCPELHRDTDGLEPPQPSGPRGQDDDD